MNSKLQRQEQEQISKSITLRNSSDTLTFVVVFKYLGHILEGTIEAQSFTGACNNLKDALSPRAEILGIYHAAYGTSKSNSDVHEVIFKK